MDSCFSICVAHTKRIRGKREAERERERKSEKERKREEKFKGKVFYSVVPFILGQWKKRNSQQ